MSTTGRLKYLVVPACTNLKESNAKSWLPLLRKEKPLHGILGYVGGYPGDETGAQIMRRFGELIQRNPDINFIEAWKQANGKSPWGALQLEAARGDTMRRWVSEQGLSVPSGSVKVLHFDASHPGGKVPNETEDFEAVFHMADGTPITEANNQQSNADRGIAAFIPGQKGSLLLKANTGRFEDGEKMVVIFFYWRSDKLKVDLNQLLIFDPKPGKLELIEDQNKDSPSPAKRVDAFRYTFSAAESKEARLTYTVHPQAHQAPKLDRDGPNAKTFGRFYVGLLPQRIAGRFADRIEMYSKGVYLREPLAP